MHEDASPRSRAPIAFLAAALVLSAAAMGWLGWRYYQEYEAQKGLHAAGMPGLAGGVDRADAAALERESRQALLNLAVGALTIPFLTAAWLVVFRATRKWRHALVSQGSQAEMQLQRLAMVAQQAGEGIALADLDGVLQFVNAAWARLHGYDSGDELVGKHLSIFHTSEQMTGEALPFNEQVRRTGRHCGEVGHVRKDGVAFTMGMTVTLLKNAAGTPIGLAALAADITERRRADEAVRTSEEKLRAILDNVGIGITLNGTDLRVISVNNQMKKWFPGVDAAGRPTCYRVFNDPPREAPCPECPVVRTLQDGQVHDVVRATPAGNETRYYRVISSPLKDSDGRVTAVIEMVEDISDQRRAERALADSEAKFRALFERTGDAVILFDGQAFFDCNDAALAVFGYTSREAFLQHNPVDLSPPTQPNGQDSLSAVNEWGATALATGTARFEWMHRRADGTDFPADVLLNSIDLGGRTVVQAVVRDISSRKQAEEALRASEEKFRTLVERIPAVVYAISLDGSPVAGYASPRAEAILGLSGVDVDRWAHQLHPEDRERVLAEVASCYATGEPLVTEYRLVRSDGRVVWLHDEGAIVRDQTGRPTLHLGVLLDITERKQASEKLAGTLADLELFNRLAVGRELRMIELKREVNEMARAAGLRLPYDLSSLEPGTVPDTTQDTAGDSLPALALSQEARP